MFYNFGQQPDEEPLEMVTIPKDPFNIDIGLWFLSKYQLKALAFTVSIAGFLLKLYINPSDFFLAVLWSLLLGVLPALWLGMLSNGIPMFYYINARLWFISKKIFLRFVKNISSDGITVNWQEPPRRLGRVKVGKKKRRR